MGNRRYREMGKTGEDLEANSKDGHVQTINSG